jgi:hypothetical protein
MIRKKVSALCGLRGEICKMKERFLITQKTICSLFILTLFLQAPYCFAAEAEAIAGNNYSTIAYCLDDAGDYCAKNDLKQDEFQFQGNGDFKIMSLEDDKGLIDSSSGSFTAGLTGFNGSYEATVGDRLKKYEFSFSGVSLTDVIIIGQFQAGYFEFGGFPPQYNRKGTVQAYFIGFRK